MTPMKAIRAKCLDCCCGQYKEVELRPCSNCSLYPYRFGKNPNIQMSDEQRAKRAANFKKIPIQQGEKSSLSISEITYIPHTGNREKEA